MRIDSNSYNIEATPESLQSNLIRLQDEFDEHIHDGTSSKTFETVKANTVSSEVILIRKTSLSDTRSGIWMGIVNNVMKFLLGDSNNYLQWDGTTLSIKGSIVGSTIYIPDAVNPLFSVDALGNATVTSLQRKDYNWFTVFESIDGFSKTASGAGTITCNPTSVDFVTGALANDTIEFQKQTRGGTNFFSWGKNRTMKVLVLPQNASNQEIMICSGEADSSSGGVSRKIGFYLDTSGNIYGMIGDGTTQSTLLLTTYAAGFTRLLEFRYMAGIGVTFYVDGISYGSITSNLPTGSLDSNKIMHMKFKSTSAAAKEIDISYVDFWQAG